MEPRKAEMKRLATLVEIGVALNGTLSLKAALHRAVEVLERSHGAIRSAVTLLDPASHELHTEASSGRTVEGMQARYRLGEGITGKVVQSGKPIAVPQVSREPMFLNRAGRKNLHSEEVSFFCVPLLISRRPVGALGVDYP